MDFQVLFYIIIAIVFIVGRFLKKSENAPGTAPRQNPARSVRDLQQPGANPTSSSQKTMTFEELLREIQQSKTPAPAARPKPVATPAPYIDYDDMVTDEEQDLEKRGYDYGGKGSVTDVYEQSKKQAFSRPSLEETMKVGDTVVSYGRFKAFEIETKRNVLGEYLAELRDPEGFKKAVVMNEILQRKF